MFNIFSKKGKINEHNVKGKTIYVISGTNNILFKIEIKFISLFKFIVMGKEAINDIELTSKYVSIMFLF